MNVEIRGMGLSCALGQGLKACIDALALGQINTVDIELQGLDAPISMPYYRICDGADLFDPGRFDRMIPQIAKEALSAAGLSSAETKHLPIFVGSSSFSICKSEAQYRSHLSKDSHAPFALPWVGFEHVAQTLQASLEIAGDTFAFNTACSAAANALLSAMRMIQLGKFRHALVMGIELANLTTLAGFSGLQLVSRELKPFDIHRDGIVLGEGIGVIILSASDEKNGVFLRAGANRCDTYSVTTTHPDGSTIADLQNDVLRQAGIDASQIQAIKAHATASPMNDASEAAGMCRSFASLPPICALKPYLGHTLGACGVNELILLAEALKQGFLPATPGFQMVDPKLGVSPSRQRQLAKPGYYLCNYFGFGGNNTSLLAEYLG